MALAQFKTIAKRLRRRPAHQPEPTPTPPAFVYDPPWKDWIQVLNNLRQAEDAVLAYAKRPELPAGVAGQMAHAAEQIRVGRRHDLMRLCRTPVGYPNYKPCCSHVAEALAPAKPSEELALEELLGH